MYSCGSGDNVWLPFHTTARGETVGERVGEPRAGYCGWERAARGARRAERDAREKPRSVRTAGGLGLLLVPDLAHARRSDAKDGSSGDNLHRDIERAGDARYKAPAIPGTCTE